MRHVGYLPEPGSKFVHPPYCFYRLQEFKENEVNMASNDKVHTRFLQYQPLVPNVKRGHTYKQTARYPHYPTYFP